MSQYIPDITERFPEGFDGVDMTSKYFPMERSMYDKEEEFWNTVAEIEKQEYEAMKRGEL